MSSDRPLDLDLAIVGMAGRFPGAGSVEAFWANLRAGVESIRDLADEEVRAAGGDETSLADPRFVRRAADLKDPDLFDAALFGFTPREAELMDPQFRVFLEDAWTALEDAGHFSDRRDLRVGVFAGSSGSTYLLNAIAASPRAAEAFEAMTSLGNERDYLAAHVAYRLDLRGPTFVVQTACSTSLVAVHLACQSLLGRECDIALAGGVSIGVPQTAGYLWEEGSIVSPDGRCRAFDASAAGCVKGNGSGIVVIRRLEDALRDGDRIRAVIRGSAVNNDGAVKVGFTAPGEEGQAGVIAEALAASGVDPATIGYVEAHGTATALGDPVEVAALARAFGSAAVPGAAAAGNPGAGATSSAATSPAFDASAAMADRRSGPCWLGSVKTNIGHLDAAAGVAGLIKTVLALEHREIPPSLHFERPNPRIDFARTPFRVNAELRRWDSDGGEPRRAGVSSFGIGGTNAHVVLEEAPAPHSAGHARDAGNAGQDLFARSTASGHVEHIGHAVKHLEEGSGPRGELASASGAPARRSQLIVLSAATESALASASEALAARLESPGGTLGASLADVAFTLQVGRRRLPWRRAVVASDPETAVAALRAATAGSKASGGAADGNGNGAALDRDSSGRTGRSRSVGAPGAQRRDERRSSEVAFLFPGQGAQHVGMARGLYGAEPVFREALDRCAGILQPILGLDLREMIFGDGAVRETAEERLSGTALAQPAIFAVDWALARFWMSWGVLPTAMAGHSLGELVAATLAGVLSIEDALALVAERGRLMGALPRGAMLAVAMSEADLTKRLASHPDLALAAINGPRACVASGPVPAIARLEAELNAAGLAHRRLRTSHAFHSAMMDPAVGAFEERARRVRLAPPSIPFVSNVTGGWISNEQATDPAYWAMHLRRPVRFADAIAMLAADPARILLEVGPGTTLASLARAQSSSGTTIVSSLGRRMEGVTGPKRDVRGVDQDRPAVAGRPDGISRPGDGADDGADDEASVLQAVGQLWCAGAVIDWQAVHAGSLRQRVSLPTYPFERKRYWVESGMDAVPREARARAVGETAEDTEATAAKNPDMAAWFYVPGWKRVVSPAMLSSAAEPAWLVLDDGSPLAAAVVAQAVSRGAAVVTVRPGAAFARRNTPIARPETAQATDRPALTYEIDPARREDWSALVRDLQAARALPTRIAHLWCADGSQGDGERTQDVGFFALVYLIQAYALIQAHADAGGAHDLRIVSVANRLFDVVGEEALAPERATLVGPCRVAPQEDTHLKCRLLDLGEIGPEEGARVIAAELGASDSERVVAWRGGHRWVPSYERMRLGPSPGGPPSSGSLLGVVPAPGGRLSSALRDVGSFLGVGISPGPTERDRGVGEVIGWAEAPHLAGSNLEDSGTLLTHSVVSDRPGGVYVLTGGAGPLELALAARLARSGAKGIALLDCESDTPPTLDLTATAAAEAPSGHSVTSSLAPEIMASTADASDPAAIAGALASVRRRFGRLDAVFHTAGTVGGGMIALKDRKAAEHVLAPRLCGARALLAGLHEGETLVLFSAAVSATGVFGQVDFCGASAYLDALAQSRRRKAGPRVIALDWGTTHWDRWEGVSGAGFEALKAQLLEIQAAVGITVEEGIEALGRALATGEPQVVVSTEDLDTLVAQAASSSVADFLGAASGAGSGAAGARDDGREVVAPASATESRVAAVWSDLLGIAPVGRTDNFFDLGGNSLLAIQLASRLRKDFDVDLGIGSLFESADLASLAAAVDAALDERREAEEVERLLAEIEGLSEDQIRQELVREEQSKGGSAAASVDAVRRTPAAGNAP